MLRLLGAAIEAAGAKILTCQHAFGGVGRAVRKKWGTYQVDEIVAQTLRVFGEGLKVVIVFTFTRQASFQKLVNTLQSWFRT